MKLTLKTPRQALNKAFMKVKPTRVEIENFKTNLISLLDGMICPRFNGQFKRLISC